MTYIHGHHETVLRSHRWRTAANSAGYLLPRLRPGMSLLDVGSGPGTITADLAARLSPGAVTAVEVSPAALELTRAEVRRQGRDAVRLAVADVHGLGFADDAFDVVHAHQVLQHVADPVRALTELRRVCRPGGVVAARDSDYAAFAWYPQAPGLDEWLAGYRRAARANGGQPDAGRRLLSWARAAGFAEVESTASVWCFATPGERRWWGAMWADRVVHSDLAPRLRAAGVADVGRLADAWREWADAPDGWFVVPHGEIVCRA